MGINETGSKASRLIVGNISVSTVVTISQISELDIVDLSNDWDINNCNYITCNQITFPTTISLKYQTVHDLYCHHFA